MTAIADEQLDDWKKDRYVALVGKRNRNFTPVQIATNLATAFGTHVSRLHQVDLYPRKSVEFIPLQPRHPRERLRWCKRTCWLGSPKFDLE
ncbi:hypothetical protein TNCV_2854051 [Trichonephila clavipes]|uniref:Uncharacterized protein n=1 Tax=Trichonephila clavipes TaxID=2585209 RepID=A0A8X6RC95_TRICX|nr:hypothetical protein TNCV_2854051 [Trichonephila clavipes]